MIDTHAHYNSTDIIDLDKQIEVINNSSLTAVINVGLDIKTSLETVNIAVSNKKFYATIGIHPLHDGNPEELYKIYDSSTKGKIVALGEIGLDTGGEIESQKRKFIRMIYIANELKLPIIIHSKNSNSECIEIIKKHKPLYGFVFHCFQPDLEILKQIILLDGYISVASPITRPTANKSLEVIKIIPIEKLLIELDFPYMSQNPTYDGKKVFNKIKEIKGISSLDLENILDCNAKKLFKKMNI